MDNLAPISNFSDDGSALIDAGPFASSTATWHSAPHPHSPLFPVRTLRLNGKQKIREAALLRCCNPLRRECRRLWLLSARQWQHLLHWLDISGLALYFLDSVLEHNLREMLPAKVLARLRQNLAENTERTTAMFAEFTAIRDSFVSAGLSWATLKGISLCPQSVPKLELRSQLDLDFLVAKKDAGHARRILEDRGYRLHAISGISWEFKLGQPRRASLKDLYKAVPFRTAELHLENVGPNQPSLLARTETARSRDVSFPVLSPVDLFLGQAVHLYKHVCGDFWRAAHLIEFRRHVIARYGDDAFWSELYSLASENRRAVLGLGVVTLLATLATGEFAPPALTSWTVDSLPPTVRLWVETYGWRSTLGNFPGTKLYLLLQREAELSGVPAKRSIRQSLLPSGLFPPAIAVATPNETSAERLGRHFMQFRFVLLRLRFHVVEGLRYLFASLRWRHRVREYRLR